MRWGRVTGLALFVAGIAHGGARNHIAVHKLSPQAAAGPALAILPSGPTAAQQAAGSLTTANGVTVTDTRASNVYCANSSGALVLLSNNQPCVEANGLRVEGSATNLALQSQAPATAPWTTNAVIVAAPTVTNNAAVAPDGTTTAATVAIPAVGASQASNIYQGFTATAAAYTASAYVRTSGAASTAYIFFGNSPYTAAACNITSTWTRCSVTATLTAATWFAQFGVDTRAGGMTAQAAQTVQLWGFQVEQSSFASSYIPTTTTTVTRAADNTNVTSPLSAGMPLAVAATVKFESASGVYAANARLIILSSANFQGANSWGLFVDENAGGTAIGDSDFQNYDNAVAVTESKQNAAPSSGDRFAATDIGGNLTLYRNGSSVATGTGNGLSAKQATIYLGNFNGGSSLNGWLSNICADTSRSKCQ